MSSVNWKQLIIGLKAALAAAGPSIIAVMEIIGYQATQTEKIIALAVSVLGIVLVILEKTDLTMAKDAASVPGLQVHANPQTAPKSVLEAVPKTDDLVVMVGGPREDAKKIT